MRFDLWLADACRTADVPYDDFILTIATGGYPCLPGAVPGLSPHLRRNRSAHALRLWPAACLRFRRLACRRICRPRALRAESERGRDIHRHRPDAARRQSGWWSSAKHVRPRAPTRSEKIEFNIAAIQKFLNRRVRTPLRRANLRSANPEPIAVHDPCKPVRPASVGASPSSRSTTPICSGGTLSVIRDILCGA